MLNARACALGYTYLHLVFARVYRSRLNTYCELSPVVLRISFVVSILVHVRYVRCATLYFFFSLCTANTSCRADPLALY
jgi:hypothetical protein